MYVYCNYTVSQKHPWMFLAVTRESSVGFLAIVNSFAICRRPSVRLSSVCLCVCNVRHPTQAIEIFGTVSMPFGTLAICDLWVKISG